MSIFTAIASRSEQGKQQQQHASKEEAEAEEEAALQNMIDSQRNLSIGKLGKYLRKTAPDVVSNKVQDEDNGGHISAVLATAPFTANSTNTLMNYFEIELLRLDSKSSVGIGLMAVLKDVDINMPGWTPRSFGYHSDNGNAFYNDGDGVTYGPHFEEGDVVGCGIIYPTAEVFYTKNGEFLGVSIEGCPTDSLYPAVGMTSNAEVSFNFGEKPFKFGFEVPTIRATKVQINNTPESYLVASFMNDKIRFNHSSEALQYHEFDCKTRSMVKKEFVLPALQAQPVTYHQYAAVGDEELWLFYEDLQIFRQAPSQAVVYCESLTRLKAEVYNLARDSIESVEIDFGESPELPHSVLFVSSRCPVPVVDHKMFFFNAYPPLYWDAKTRLAHLIQVPPSYRSTIYHSCLVVKDPVTKDDKILIFGGTKSPSHNCANWIEELERLMEAEDTMTNSMLVFDPKTHELSQCAYVGALTAPPREQGGLFAIDQNNLVLYGGFNGKLSSGLFEIFSYRPIEDDPLVRFFDSSDLYDVKIKARNNTVIHANKIILHARCQHFRSLLLKGDTDVLEIDEPGELVYHLVRYLYSDNVSLSLKTDDYLAFINLCERIAPEHLEQITGLLIMIQYQNNSLMSSLVSEAFGNQLYSDIEIEVQGKVFYGHKVILCSRNDYFRALCMGGLSETGRKRLVLKDLEYEPFCQAVRYLYEKQVRVEELGEDIVANLVMARILAIDELVVALENLLCLNVNQENYEQLETLAESQSLGKLRKSCFKFHTQ
eukprot:TRINITY_DN3634_c0_g2_i2.p1 TRINITY_DN3634_c0_g2~~TRINITY_DN3634_c0_g2_i2.p1  ORF type:complete len:769 (-),score=159.05 TRINITY_DN3634_c0_g2_i2:19-2325(-)